MSFSNKSIIISLCISGLILVLFLISDIDVYGVPTPDEFQKNPCPIPTNSDQSTTPITPSMTNIQKQSNFVQAIKNATFQEEMQKTKILNLTITLHVRNQNQLENCLVSINDPKSPNYHHFLNDEMLSHYIVTPGNKSSIKSFFEQHRFKEVKDGSSPLVLTMSASVGDIEDTFGVTINVYKVPVSNYANLDVSYQNQFDCLSQFRDVNGNCIIPKNPSIIFHPKNSGMFYAADSAPKLPSNIDSLVSYIGGLDNYTTATPLQFPCDNPYCPHEIQTAYTFSKLYHNGFNGSGTNVAIVDCAGDPSPDIAMHIYDHQFGLSPTQLHFYYPDGPPTNYSPSWAGETMMDIQAVHTIAPGATIHLIYVNCDLGSPMDGVDYVATHHVANIVSNSWSFTCSTGACSDVQLSSSFVESNHNRLAIDAAKGLTILFASGDNGATPDGVNKGVEFPASDPNVLAVGATNLILQTCMDTSCSDYVESGSKISGGGYSGYFAEPSWQTDVIGEKSGRAIPDVSMLGAARPFWVYSTHSNQCGNVQNATGGWFGCSGTSLSTPLWAGYLAIMKQKYNLTSFGNVAPYLYDTYNNTNLGSFHDIVSGSNNSTGQGYSAQVGWDPVTGLGTPIADKISIIPEFPFASIIVMFLAFLTLISITHLHFFKKWF